MTPIGRVLLADDSPHAQRMGERILREEGYEVVTVTDGETAIMRIKDVDPDILIVDAFLPQVSGYDLCGYIKKQPQHSHVRVLLTSTALEKVDDDHAFKVGADGQLKKPFEASVMLKSLKELIGGSDKDKKKRAGTTLDLSSPTEPTALPEEDTAEESTAKPEGKPVSALQAWLEQHETENLDGPPQDPAPGDILAETVQAAEAKAGPGQSPARLSNPQLLRNADDEPEDLSLRNNPVARLRQTEHPRESEKAEPAAASGASAAEAASSGPTVRSFRMPSLVPPLEHAAEPSESRDDDSSGGPVRLPRKSLLEALEEYEKASQIADEPEPEDILLPEEAASAPVADPEEAKAPAAGVLTPLEQEVEEALRSEAAEKEAEEAKAASEPEAAPEESVPQPVAEEPLMAEAPVAEAPVAAASTEEPVLEVEEATEPVAAVAVAEAPVDVTDGGHHPEPAASPAPLPGASPAMAAIAEATAVSLAESGVRLDEEEVRAAVEIAVSAAMPTIVDAVARCVFLALESRMADAGEASKNGNQAHD